MYRTITVQTEEFINTITLNMPEKMNVFTSLLAEELNEALLAADRDSDVRVVVINANGRGFSAGIDLNELKDKNFTEYYETTSLMEKMNITITGMKKPVIASVHGFAVANGMGLVALCDLAIAEEGTKFGLTAINVGLSCIGPSLAVSKSLGRKRTLDLLFTGRIITAEEAERIGLINRVVEKGKLKEETYALAKELARKSPLALQITKKAFYRMADAEFSKALEIANYAFSHICTLEDAKEGMEAFLTKREPVWRMK